MNMVNSPLTTFIASVRRRLNVHRFWTVVVWSAAVGTMAMLLVALIYVIRGYAVPATVYWAGGGGIVVFAVGAWAVRRVTQEAAAGFADKFYELDDTVTSCHHFRQSGKTDGFYALQAQQTEQRVQSLPAETIRLQLPRRAVAVALVCGVIAVLLGFKAPSPAVLQRLADEQQTLKQTQEMNDQLKEEIDRLEQSIEDPEQRELLASDELRRWVDELKETKNRKEALRQYGALERKLNEASARLLQKRDEQLVDRAAKQLAKDRATKPLAESLKQKEYDKGAAELNKLKPTKKKLDQQRKELARLRAAAKRMATAAGSFNRGKSGENAKATAGTGKNSRPSQASSGGSGKNSSRSSSASLTGSQASASKLEDAIMELDEAVDLWDDALTEAELEKLEKADCDAETLEECARCRACAGEKLDRIGEELRRLALKRRARSKLAKLCQSCSQCQSALCTSSSTTAGGKKAGWGSDDTRRDEKDKLIDNGQHTQLKGMKGSGPSLATVESADDGTGVSTRRQTTRQRSFQRQVESFVQREDVPDSVKAGVKEYFENIHTADELQK